MARDMRLADLTLGQVAELAKRNGIDPKSELEKLVNTNIPSFAD